MATVKLFLYDYYKKQDSNKVPLYIRIIHNRKPKYISLGINVDPKKEWDAENLRVKKCFPNSSRVNTFIAKKLVEAEKLALDMEEKKTTLTKQRIRHEIYGKPTEDFIAFGKMLSQRLNKTGKTRTEIRYKSVLRKLQRYLDGKPFTFDDFTVSFLHEYEAHLKSIGNEINTIHTNLKTLRAMLYIAIREDKFPQEKNPFFKFKLKKAPTKKERLSMDEIRKLANLQLREGTNIYHTRNAFLFSFYCAGIRIGDLFQLKWKNVAEILDYQMGKTKQYRRIKLVKQAKGILDCYRPEVINPEYFIFPFLKNDIDYSNEKFLMTQISSKTVIVNKHLKELANKIETKKKITSHIARHSFADIARKKGMKLYDISKALGHSSLAITEKYLANFDDSTLDDAMDNLFN